jgi:nucleoside-triphosphatase THEP1
MSHPAEAGQPPVAQPGQPADFRRDAYFTWPERVPWSELEQDFTGAWGRADPADPQPEGMEIVGQNGSGKTYLLCSALQARMIRRQTPAVIVCTKKADRVFDRLGWPVVDRPDDLNRHPNAIFWPRTGAMGNERKAFYDRKISDLLARLWVADSNRIVAFDEIGFVESLSGDLRATVQQYWREGRSVGITVVAMKQRPQGTQRDMHSESYWTAAFKPKDRGDLERWAELYGAPRDWMPVIDSLTEHGDRGEQREFILRHSRSSEAYISWIDTPLQPVDPPKARPAWMPGKKAPTPT